MIIVKNNKATFKGCEMEVMNDLMVLIRIAHDYMSEYHDEEFANENITRIIKIALGTDDKEEFNDCRAKYLKEMSESLCEGCDAGCIIEKSANPLAGLFDFLDGIKERADEDEDDDELEMGDVTVITAQTPEEVLEGLNRIVSGILQKDQKEGEE